MNVRMTDSPGDYEAVYVDVQGAAVHSDQSGWVDLSTHAGVYDLLTLMNGIDALIAAGDIPSGNVSQVRLKLGANNSVKINGNTFPLNVPSGAESGLKLNVHYDIQPGQTYNVSLDFDAAQSVVAAGSGKYELKPVIHVITTADGSIQGTVVPSMAQPAIIAEGSAGTFTTYANASGNFTLRAPAGDYKVTFDAKAPYPDLVMNVTVRAGATTSLGTVTLGGGLDYHQ